MTTAKDNLAASAHGTSWARELLSVDVHGMKDALAERAHAENMSVSAFVRNALARALDASPIHGADGPRADSTAGDLDRVRVSLRLHRSEADELARRASDAGLPLGAYIVALMFDAGHVPSAADLRSTIEALARSNAELATLGRGIAQLTRLLAQGSVPEAQAYRSALDRLADDVRAHLELAARALADGRQTRTTHRRRPS